MPPTSRSHRASSAPVVQPIDGHGHNGRLHIEPNELCVGCIVWLPHKVPSADRIECNRANCCGKELDDGGYEHPVVVLKIKQREESHLLGDLICVVAAITSFGTTSLQEYLEDRRRKSCPRETIPIRDPAAALLEIESIEGIEYLDIEKGALHKQSYVKLKHTYEIPASALCQYNFRAVRAYSLRLKQASYKLLMRKLDLEAQTFIATSQMKLKSAREARLKALAGVPATQAAPSTSAFPPLPPSPRLHRSDLQHGTIPASLWTQPLPTPSRIQPVRYPTAPNTTAHLPITTPATRLPASNSYNTTYTPNNLHPQSTYYGTISTPIPTYQPPVQARRYTPPEPEYPPANNGNDGDGFVILVIIIIIGTLIYWNSR